MRIAFYAPLKPPTHRVPSGDRRMARLLVTALGRAGHRVELASRLRSLDLSGDPARQHAIEGRARRVAARLARSYGARASPDRPAAWFTYHVYYKAPDWIGPAVADALAIPYIVAEASHAPKRAGGPWAAGHEAAAAAIRRADAVLTLNPADGECLTALRGGRRAVELRPFLDAEPYLAAARRRHLVRPCLARRFSLRPDVPWLLTVAMMRPGDKLASYRVLADSLTRLDARDWRLVVVGDGPARSEVHAALAGLADRTVYAGLLPPDSLPEIYAAADLCVWPAVNEAYGMTLLEAQAAGLPVVAGAVGGVASIVAHAVTGLLPPVGDATAFAAAVAVLLADPERRRSMGDAALKKVATGHGIAAAAETLDTSLRACIAARAR